MGTIRQHRTTRRRRPEASTSIGRCASVRTVPRGGLRKMIKIAVFGAGRIGQVHAHNAAAHGAVELRYIVDPVGTAAADLAALTGAAAADADTVFADDSLDGVIIASATNTHAGLVERRRRHGKGRVVRETAQRRLRDGGSVCRGHRAQRHPLHGRLPAPLRRELSRRARADPRWQRRNGLSDQHVLARAGTGVPRLPQGLGRPVPRFVDPRLRHGALPCRWRVRDRLRRRRQPGRSGDRRHRRYRHRP